MIMPRASTHSNPALLLLHTVNCRFYQRAAKRFRINSKISSKLATFSIRSAYFWRGVSQEVTHVLHSVWSAYFQSYRRNSAKVVLSIRGVQEIVLGREKSREAALCRV